MRFEEIAKKLSKEEGRYVSPYYVKRIYYHALRKLQAAHPEGLEDYLEDDYEPDEESHNEILRKYKCWD